MVNIIVDSELWASSMLPEGIVEKWLVAPGALVKAGDPLAEIRIEDALHELLAPAAGCLIVDAAPDALIEPGSVIGRILLLPVTVS